MRGVALAVSSVMLTSAAAGPSLASNIKHVIVIVMENHDAQTMYGDLLHTPYIHKLYLSFAHAANFEDELPTLHASEPHYIWMEADTNSFPDHTFTKDAEPSAKNSTEARRTLSLKSRLLGRRLGAAYQEACLSG